MMHLCGAGCESARSNTITVVGREFNPTISTSIPKMFCMEGNGDTEYDVTIVYAEDLPKPTDRYKFDIHIEGTGVDRTVPSTDATLVKAANTYTYHFTFKAKTYDLTLGEARIYVTTKEGGTLIGCESEVYKFDIQPQPNKHNFPDWHLLPLHSSSAHNCRLCHIHFSWCNQCCLHSRESEP